MVAFNFSSNGRGHLRLLVCRLLGQARTRRRDDAQAAGAWENSMSGPGGRPITLRKPWGDLACAVGGVGALAKALGVSDRTIQRWSSGVVPNVHVREHVVKFARRYRIKIEWDTTGVTRTVSDVKSLSRKAAREKGNKSQGPAYH